MKKTAFLLALTFGGLLLFGCNNRLGLNNISQAQASELKAMQQHWYGVFPCADCAGIETSLFLDKSGKWVMQQLYRSSQQQNHFTSRGNWARTADKLILTETDGTKYYFRVKNDSLEMTNSDGDTSPSGLIYRLNPVEGP